MHYTINGCYHTEIKVIPANWKKRRKALKPGETWIIYYRYYDPQFRESPELWGKLIRLKGMNEAKQLADRQRITQDLITQEIDLLHKRMWNPVTGKFMIEMPTEKSPSFSLEKALWWAFERTKCIQQTKTDIKSVINGFLSAADELFDTELMLPYSKIPVKKFTRSKVYLTLDKCSELNARFSDNRFNVYKAYLSFFRSNVS